MFEHEWNTVDDQNVLGLFIDVKLIHSAIFGQIKYDQQDLGLINIDRKKETNVDK